MRTRLPLTAAALAAAGSVLLPTAAQAGSPTCPSGHFCAWIHANYEGERGSWYGSDGYWANNTTASQHALNNNTSSWANNGVTGPGVPSVVRVYDGFWGYGTYLICLRAGYVLKYSSSANDRPSSHYWQYDC